MYLRVFIIISYINLRAHADRYRGIIAALLYAVRGSEIKYTLTVFLSPVPPRRPAVAGRDTPSILIAESAINPRAAATLSCETHVITPATIFMNSPRPYF